MKDLFGKAILDYQTNTSPENMITSTSISDDDEMEVVYLFRSFAEMPTLEQKALQLTKGRTLEVGCGAGSHGLYLQNERNIDVHSIDISENAITACTLRGLKNTQVIDVLNIENEKYDTILLLMNGTGIFETLERTPIYLQKLKSLLNPNGQILIDSSDIIYMFDEDEDGGNGFRVIPIMANSLLLFNIKTKQKLLFHGFIWITIHCKMRQSRMDCNASSFWRAIILII